MLKNIFKNYYKNDNEVIMKNYDFDLIKLLLNEKQQKNEQQLLKYFSKLPTSIILEIFDIQRNLKSKFLATGKDTYKGKITELNYACLIIAIDNIYQFELNLKKKSQWTTAEAEKATLLKIERFKTEKKRKRKSKKADLVRIRFFTLIKKLRDENFSWRDISSYLAKNHKVKISHDFLRKVYLQELEND